MAEPEDAGANPAYLFVQLFDQGTWLPKPDEEGTYLLTLSGGSAQTLYFSDRPERIVGTVPTDRFLEGLGFTPAEPPNAALVARTPDDERDVLVLELFNPVYTQEFDADGGVRLTYEARLIDAYEGDGLQDWAQELDGSELPSEISDVSLFIDDCADITSCWMFINTANGPFRGYVGPVPGGPYGRCWNADQINCIPCQNDYDYYDNLCNNQYAACGGQCFVGACWAGIC